MSMGSEGIFLSALQPNSSTVSTYAVPSETQLPHGGTHLDEASRAKRVQQQVAQRLAEKSTLTRRNTSTSTSAQYATTTSTHYATSAQYPTSGVSPFTCSQPRNALPLYTFNCYSVFDLYVVYHNLICSFNWLLAYINFFLVRFQVWCLGCP